MIQNRIFVFGSNMAGRHGKGSALEAHKHWGAENGIGWGRTGMAYAIPTKSSKLTPLSLTYIQQQVDIFIQYAKEHPELVFQVVAIGCGLAGYKHEEIAPMFKDAPINCDLPDNWRKMHEPGS